MTPADRQQICGSMISRLKKKFRRIDFETETEIIVAVDDSLKEWFEGLSRNTKQQLNRKLLAEAPK